MKVVDALARILKIEGTEFLSAYPTTALIEAAAKADIRPVLCRQERVGVGIADGYARVKNGKTLAVFCMQYGPGAENAFPGVATAYSDSTPMLLLPLGQFHEFLFTPGNFFLCGRVADRPSRADFVEPAIKNVEFFANFPDTLEPGRVIHTSVPYGFEVPLQQVDQRSRLRAFDELECRTAIVFGQFQIDDIFVDLIFVPPEGHSHFVQPDIAPQGFHLIDRFHVKLLGFVDGSVEFLQTTQRVVTLIGYPWRVISFDPIQGPLRLPQSRGPLLQLQKALSRKHTSIRRACWCLLPFENFSRALGQFLSC